MNKYLLTALTIIPMLTGVTAQARSKSETLKLDTQLICRHIDQSSYFGVIVHLSKLGTAEGVRETSVDGEVIADPLEEGDYVIDKSGVIHIYGQMATQRVRNGQRLKSSYFERQELITMTWVNGRTWIAKVTAPFAPADMTLECQDPGK